MKRALRLVAVVLAAVLAGGASAALPEMTGGSVGVAAADAPRVCSGGTIAGLLVNTSQHDNYTVYVPHNATVRVSGQIYVNSYLPGNAPDYDAYFQLEYFDSSGHWLDSSDPATDTHLGVQSHPYSFSYARDWVYGGASADLTLRTFIQPFGGANVGYNLVVTTSAIGGPSCPPGPVTAAETRGCNASEANVAGAQEKCGDPIDTATGNLHEDFTDLSIPGRGVPLLYTRSYNSDPKLKLPAGSLGYGWTDSYHMNVAVTNGTLATVTQETGAKVSFNQSGSDWIPLAPRLEATLVRNGDGTWTFTRRATEIFTFDASGKLTNEQDLSGAAASTPYATTLAYNGSGQLSTVTDPAGRTLAFEYWPTGTGAGKDGLLHTVTDSAARTVTYDYSDGNSNLTDVVDAGGGHWQFTYWVCSPVLAPPERVVLV